MADTERFLSVYEKHVERVHGFFAYRIGSREEAEDLTQQTFEKALQAWDRFDYNRASARTWLMAIAHNLLVDAYRRRAARPTEPLGEDADELAAPPQGGINDLGLAPELEAALAKLDQRQRELIALRFGADLTGPQIAEVTGLSLANVQQILSRSLRALRDELSAA